MKKSIDVLIIGGGPAGAAAAITLSRYTDLSVALVERAEFDDYRAGESVSPSIFPLLSYLGIEREQLEEIHLPSYGHAAAWGSDQLIVRDLLFSGQGNGLHLDRRQFDELLLDEAQKHGTLLYRPARIAEISKAENWEVKIKTTEEQIELSARYVIDCSGKNALIVKQQQCKVHKEDNLVALYGYYALDDEQIVPHQTVLETTEHGWYYLSPLPNKKVAIAFITDADILKALDLNNPNAWLDYGLKTQHISTILSQLPDPEAFRHYAINSKVALIPGSDNWIAAGDAAACFDPISALGIGHAINSGINSARVVEHYFSGNHDTGKAYSRFVLDHFGTYLDMRKGYYASEQRWAASPFWQRRAVKVAQEN
jgi:flavin-dependent dehydrogenase